MQNIMKGIRCILVWILLSGISLCVYQSTVSAQDDPLNLYARSAVLMDGDSGRILYGKESNTVLPMASTTKIMTCIVALEQADGNMVCTVSANAASQPKVKLGMQAGDQFYLKDLLYSLMLESHNDTAVCIAENVSDSVESFAALMNQKAEEIGCVNTCYITPNGLDAEQGEDAHQTTAAELAWIMRYCTSASDKKEEFLEITQTDSWAFSDLSGRKTYQCKNHNTLLHMMDGVISGKTGFTNKAGYCYVGAMKKDGKYLIISLLACGWPNNRGYKWSDSKKLLRYGMENYQVYEMDHSGISTKPIQIINGKKSEVQTKIEKGSGNKKKILLNDQEKISVKVEQQTEMKAPVKAEMDVGMLTYSIGDFTAAQYRIITAEASEEKDFIYCLEMCAELLFL